MLLGGGLRSPSAFLVKYSGKYVKIYFNMKITFITIHSLNT